MDERDNRFDAEQILRWDRAKRGEGNQAPFDPDAEIVLTWDIPYGSFEECRRWLYANRQVVTDTETQFDLMDGVWRIKEVKLRPTESTEDSSGGEMLVRYAKGFYTSIDWNAARVVSFERSAGNTSSVNGVSTDSPKRFVTIRFPFCSNEHVVSMASSLGSASYSDVVVQGNPLTGEWRNIFAATKMEDDGTHSIYLQLARPKYILNAYSDLGGINNTDVAYLWDVPEDMAQPIIDGWKAANPLGASASADYSSDKKLVSIILRKRGEQIPNLSLDPVNISCDRTQTQHLGWGYEEADIPGFIANHNSAFTSATPGSRQLSINERNGLFDIIITEIYVVAATPPHFSIILPSGDKITNTLSYGWNISKSQLDGIKTVYETKVLGKVQNFQLTREDDCSFDFIASSVVEDEQSAELSISGSGVNVRQKWFRSAADTAGHGITSGPRKRVNGRIERMENGKLAYVVDEQTVVEIPQKTLMGSHAGKKILYGENTTPPTSVVGAIQQAFISTKDDGTAGHTIVVKDTGNPATVTHTYRSKGVIYSITAKAGTSLSDLPSASSSAQGEENNFSPRPDDDGSMDWSHLNAKWQPLDEEAKAGTSLFKRTSKFWQNAKTDDLDGLAGDELPDGKTRGVSVRIDPVSGKLEISSDEVEAVESRETVDHEDDGLVKKIIKRQRNRTSTYDIGDNLGSSDSRINDDNLIDAALETLTLSPHLSGFTVQRNVSRIEVDSQERSFMPTSAATSYKNVDGEYKRKRQIEHKFYDVLVEKYRGVTIVENVTFSLEPINADPTTASGTEPYEQESFVDIPRAGLFRKITRTTVATPWSYKPMNSWRQYATAWYITESESGSSNG